MKAKQFVVNEQLNIKVYKRSTSRSIRLSISPTGEIRVSIPTWLPYRAGVEFAKSKQAWILTKLPKTNLIKNNQSIGKYHHLSFIETGSNRITTRLNDFEAVIFFPKQYSITKPPVQVAAQRVAKRALMAEANKLLPIRLNQLASKYGYGYQSVTIKSLKTRWGSCDTHNNIALNLYLMKLPWELIDYVLVHELNHTKIMHHGPKFWEEMTKKLPNVKVLRKQLKNFSPAI